MSSGFVAACRGQGAPGRRSSTWRQVEGARSPRGQGAPGACRVPRACALACLRRRGRSGARVPARGRGRARSARPCQGASGFFPICLHMRFGPGFRSKVSVDFLNAGFWSDFGWRSKSWLEKLASPHMRHGPSSSGVPSGTTPGVKDAVASGEAGSARCPGPSHRSRSRSELPPLQQAPASRRLESPHDA